jgi:hypothetical protein
MWGTKSLKNGVTYSKYSIFSKMKNCVPYVKHHMGLKEHTNWIIINTNTITNVFFNHRWHIQVVGYATFLSIHIGMKALVNKSGCHLPTIHPSHGWRVVHKPTKNWGTLQTSLRSLRLFHNTLSPSAPII